jgi:hypothetical protein
MPGYNIGPRYILISHDDHCHANDSRHEKSGVFEDVKRECGRGTDERSEEGNNEDTLWDFDVGPQQ